MRAEEVVVMDEEKREEVMKWLERRGEGFLRWSFRFRLDIKSQRNRQFLAVSMKLKLTKPNKTHGSTLRVAYQGVLGVYFEATTGKAYPKSEDIRCDQFDVAFQAVELWIADRLVLPIET
ncbi:unnamed protein product [Arabidopsis lyrata]|uniref:Predicted protein n=1 Tax=Arabidopsis lyrata subsp. lyrata TaxID=81972 RepID=D7LJ97_ARALL|nr:predicted protein [Arabidopsis lyrata subsp. lyrata]CAH8264968.1 unnamed protein product [Arabidopsis lyrata]